MFAEYSLNSPVVLYQSSPTRINQIIRQSFLATPANNSGMRINTQFRGMPVKYLRVLSDKYAIFGII